MPIEDTSDTQCPDAGYSCLLSGCRTAAVPHLVAQYLGKMYATNPPPGTLPPCIFPRSSFPIGILDYIFLIMCATRRRLCSTSWFRASKSPSAHCRRYSRSCWAVSGLGNDPAPPDRCSDKNRLLHSNSKNADSIPAYLPFSEPMPHRPVPMPTGKAAFPVAARRRMCYTGYSNY